MSKLQWYWQRLRAMDTAEVMGRMRRKACQWVDRGYRAKPWPTSLAASGSHPVLPDPNAAPEPLREALEKDMAALLTGHWRAFGHIPIQVDDPPCWQKDYLAGADVARDVSAFTLDHRALPEGADVKLVWELSRWSPLVRLAMAAFVLSEERAGACCLRWLEHWRDRNPPYRGLNWTSALEVGMRLIQFTWIDALLSQRPEWEERLESLRRDLLAPHVRHAWRYRSLGSSANNHLLGELAGLIQALVRWPELERRAVPVSHLQSLWEAEVLAQFAPDGGNREQALHYHLFAFELCWQTRQALALSGRGIAPAVAERLSRAADFFVTVQVESDPWDYGDSDDAQVTPLMVDEATAVAEWHAWLNEPASSPALHFWLGKGPEPVQPPACKVVEEDWLWYPDSGQAICWRDRWTLRFDVSPQGYLSMAAHGHLDALHLSLWHRGIAFVIDPGTGAYYGDARLRAYLASWAAHNGPVPRLGSGFPRRAGPFLWSELHAAPRFGAVGDGEIEAFLDRPDGTTHRRIKRRETGWQVEDEFLPSASRGDASFEVHWQFAPGTTIEPFKERQFRVTRQGVSLVMGVDAAWASLEVVHPTGREEEPGAGWVSPGFRQVGYAPQMRLRTRGHNPCLFRTTFLASADS